MTIVRFPVHEGMKLKLRSYKELAALENSLHESGKSWYDAGFIDCINDEMFFFIKDMANKCVTVENTWGDETSWAINLVEDTDHWTWDVAWFELPVNFIADMEL